MDPALPVDLPFDLKHNPTILNMTLSQVEIWAPYSSSTSHWRTSFKFSELIKTTRKKGHNASDSDSDEHNDNHNDDDTYVEGISVDMCLPLMHIYSMNLPFDVDNRCGSLKLMIRDQGRLTAHNVICSSVFPIRQGTTARDLLKLLDSKNLQYYEFNEKGTGCLFWQMTWLRALVESKFIQSDSDPYVVLEKAVTSFQKNWTGNKAMIIWPPVAGTFYKPREKGKKYSILPMTSK